MPSLSNTAQSPLFDFAAISDYIIPRQEFCDQLVTVCINRFRVIGHPVCIVDPKKYERNEFIFNFALVIDEEAGIHSYERIIRKLARLFRNLEEQGSVLSIEEAQLERHIATPVEGSIGAKVYALCEMLLEDLNNHSECMIPIGT